MNLYDANLIIGGIEEHTIIEFRVEVLLHEQLLSIEEGVQDETLLHAQCVADHVGGIGWHECEVH